jgi:hypothetical protein
MDRKSLEVQMIDVARIQELNAQSERIALELSDMLSSREVLIAQTVFSEKLADAVSAAAKQEAQ